MHTGVRLDWLSFAITGDETTRAAILAMDKEIPGISMYWHGRQGEGYKIFAQDDFTDKYPVAQLTIDHALLWGYKIERIAEILERVCLLPGVACYHISRVDIGTLTDGLMIPRHDIDSFIERARGKVRKQNIRHVGKGGITETVYAGNRKKAMLRIYDKMKELIAHLPQKAYVFAEVAKWERCYTVEYELHRDWLKERNIYSFSDLLGQLMDGSLWRYLTKQLFWLAEDSDTFYIADEWADVQGADWMCGLVYDELELFIHRTADVERMYSLIRGLAHRLAREQGATEVRHKLVEFMRDLGDYDNERDEPKKVTWVKLRKVS